MSAPVSLLSFRSKSSSRRVTGRNGFKMGPGRFLAALLGLAGVCAGAGTVQAQGMRPMGVPTPAREQPRGFFFFRQQPQKPVAQAIVPRQEGPKISAQLMELATPDNTNVVVSLSRQRVFVMMQGQVVIDSPISSGKPGHTTPSGSFRITEKELNHFSSIYGNFVDRTGRVVRSGVSSRIDSAPSGTHFEGAPMRFFMRLTDGGVGMHIGILPGYAASHGCVRLPTDVAPLIYSKVKIGTPVSVQD